MKQLKRLKSLALALIVASPVAGAEVLWDNGDPDNANPLGYGVDSGTMDDFYVPGAGWWIESAETLGIYLNAGHVVSDVEVRIWAHDMFAGEPNGSNTTFLPVNNFEAVPTGNQYAGYDEIRVSVNFDRTFLDGQWFYWIEFIIRNQFGEANFRYRARQNITHNPAHIHVSNLGSPNSSDLDATARDLSYVLHGNDVRMINISGSSDFKQTEISPGRESHTLFLAQGSLEQHSFFDPGLYQIERVDGKPRLFYYGENDRIEVGFGSSREPVEVSTPLGDYMCEGAPGSLQDYCQTMVACAAYELFCYF